MKTLNKLSKYILTAAISAQGVIANAQTGSVDLRFGLKNRELMYTKYQTALRRLNNPDDLDTLKAWVALAKTQYPDLLNKAYQSMQSVVKNQTVIEFAAQAYLSQDVASLKSVLGLYYHQLATVVWEISSSPMSDAGFKQEAYKLLSQASGVAGQVEQCVEQNAKNGGGTAAGLVSLVQACLSSNANVDSLLDFTSKVLNYTKGRGTNQITTPAGYIGGNKVELLTQNIYDKAFIEYLAPFTHKVQNANSSLGKPYSQMTVEDFKSLMKDEKGAVTDIFSKAEGFPQEEHAIWSKTKANQEKNMYGHMMEAMKQAEQAIFIDVFFIGGSVGISLAKQLMALSQAKPNLHIYVLNDRKNPLGYDKEMRPAYNYLRAYAEKFPASRIMVTEPRIDLKRTSYPNFMDTLLTDETLRKTLGTSSQDFKVKMGFYPKAKSDHSKIVVVDPKSSKGIAFVGSKNFTDSSGAVSYDEVVKIQGPAVAAVTDSYYYDLLEAVAELQTTAPAYLKNLAQRSAKSSAQDAIGMAKDILRPMDILNRTDSNYLNNINSSEALKIPAVGNTIVAIGENNVYGTIRSALSQDVYAIMNAKKQIIISDQFMWDETVIKALREKVRKDMIPVYVLLGAQDDITDPAKNFVRIPNVVFLNDLLATGKIKIKWKKTPTEDGVGLTNVKNKYGVMLSPEYHLKGISVDGVTAEQRGMCAQLSNDKQVVWDLNQVQKLKSAMQGQVPALISGSANKDTMTMLGGFREFQVMIFDAEATIKHDCLFWARYEDPDHAINVAGSNGRVNYDLIMLPKEVTDKGITGPLFNEILKRIMTGAYNTTGEYFDTKK